MGIGWCCWLCVGWWWGGGCCEWVRRAGLGHRLVQLAMCGAGGGAVVGGGCCEWVRMAGHGHRLVLLAMCGLVVGWWVL